MVPTSRPLVVGDDTAAAGRGERGVEQGAERPRRRRDGASAVEQVAGDLVLDGRRAHPADGLAVIADGEHHGVPTARTSSPRRRGEPWARRLARLGRGSEGQCAVAPVAADETGDEVVDRVGEQPGRRVELGETRRRAARQPGTELTASSMSWVTKRIVLPSSDWSRRNSFCSCSRTTGSTAEKGSSMSMTGGSAASARATPTRCCWPPESWAGSAAPSPGRGRRAR